jgi:hypothetical protein
MNPEIENFGRSLRSGFHEKDPLRDPVKVIRANTHNIDELDDPSYPLLMQVSLRAPDFMPLTFIAVYGSSEEVVVVRGESIQDLLDWLWACQISNHPRLRSIVIVDDKGKVVRSRTGRGPWTPALEDGTTFELIRSHLLGE